MECDFSERYPGAIMFSQQKVMTDSDDDDPSQKAWRGGTSIWLLAGTSDCPKALQWLSEAFPASFDGPTMVCTYQTPHSYFVTTQF